MIHRAMSRRVEKREELNFLRARDAIFVSGRLTYRQKLAQLRLLEVKQCQLLARRPRLLLEIKRRIAETIFDLSLSRGYDIATYRTKLKAIERLGFSSIEQKSHYVLMYARTAWKQGHQRIALNSGEQMIQELRRSLSRRHSLLGRELLGRFEQLVSNVTKA